MNMRFDVYNIRFFISLRVYADIWHKNTMHNANNTNAEYNISWLSLSLSFSLSLMHTIA